jgi:hypothetical protein
VPLIPFLLIAHLKASSVWLAGSAARRDQSLVRRIARIAAVLILIASLPYSTYSALMGRSRARMPAVAILT